MPSYLLINYCSCLLVLQYIRTVGVLTIPRRTFPRGSTTFGSSLLCLLTE